MTEDDLRKAAMDQLDRPTDKLLAIIEDNPPLAEQQERVRFGERCLWGASVALAALGIEEDRQANSAVGMSWWMLWDYIEAARQRWTEDEREEFDHDRAARRQAVWDAAEAKLKQITAYSGKPFAWRVQVSTDTPRKMRYDFDVRYGHEKGTLDVHDPFTGEWHTIEAKAAPASWRHIAREKWQKLKLERAAR